MSPTRVVVALTVLAVVGGIAFLLFSPYLTGEDYLKDFFLQQLEQSLGRKIDVHRVKLVLFPKIRLELSQVAVHERNSPQIMLSAKKLDLVLRLLPLLRKQLVGKRLTVEEPVLTVRRDRAGHWNVLDRASPIPRSDEEAVQLMTRVFRIKEATIVNGTVIVSDEARPDGVRTAKLESVDASVVIQVERNQADVHLSANHAGAQGLSSVSLTGLVRKAEQQKLASDDSSKPELALQFDGQLEAANVSLPDIADFFGPRPVPAQLAGAINLRCGLRLMPGVAGYDVVLSDLTASLDPVTLTGRANVSGLLTPQPTFSVTFSATPVQLSEFLKRIPAAWFHPQLPLLIQDRRINGTIEVTSATVIGSYAEGPQVSVTGEFHVRDGQALVGESRIEAKNLQAVVYVEAGRIRVTNLTGEYGTIHMADSKGLISFLEAGPWLEMEIAGSMAATDLLQFLSKTVKSEQLSKLLAAARDVEGMASPTFRLVGPLNQPGGITFAGGEITARQVSLTHPAVPERLTAIQGRFVLSEGATEFDQVTGHLGDLTVQVQGGITGGSASAFRDFLVRVTGDAVHMTQLLPTTAFPRGLLEGRASAGVALSGQTTAPHLRGEIGLTESKVTWPDWLEKPVGAAATIWFEGDAAKGGLTLSRIEADVPPLRVPVKGKIHVGDRFFIDAAVSTGTVSLSAVPEWITKGGFEAGNVELSLDVKGRDLDWRNWKANGWLALTNGLMNVRGADGPIQDLYLRVQLLRDVAELKRLSFRLRDSDVALEAIIKNWTTKPVISAKLESNQMDIDLLIPKGARSPIREFLEMLAATSRVSATASITRGHYKHLKFGGLSARITIQDGVLDVDRVVGQSTNGEIAGRLVVQLPRHQPAEAEVSVRATGLLVGDMMRLAGRQEGGITGEIRISGTMRGHGRNPHGVYPTLNGKADVLLQNGRIFKSQERTIWKIISILNLPAVLQGKVDLEKEGLPYNKITATLTIRNGLFETENLIIDSPIVKITAAGNYDLPTDQLDMVWAVSPFGSYSQFLKTIPLFGRLFAGERKGFATAIFSVKGSIEDPQVTYLPAKSFATGLTGLAQLAVDVLKNTVMLPIDLMSTDEDKIPSKDAIPPSESVVPSP
ncbi:MAG TPA: AsmA-like C-terminal domain-containing protein [Nitrospira sp.]|nr:AsmA-like C-terminal domain-containing protein [Nitrospira sp.]